MTMAEPQAGANSTVVPLASSTAMVVDDQSTSRAILEQVLRALDERIMVKSFTRPVDAIVWATRQVADLVLLDYAMPEMNGTDLVRRLRAMPGYEHVPIVMVTVNDEREVRYKALDAGVTDFLTKPVSDLALISRVRSLSRLKMVTDELRMRALTSREIGIQSAEREAVSETGRGGRVLAHRIDVTRDPVAHEQWLHSAPLLTLEIACRAHQTVAEERPHLSE